MIYRKVPQSPGRWSPSNSPDDVQQELTAIEWIVVGSRPVRDRALNPSVVVETGQQFALSPGERRDRLLQVMRPRRRNLTDQPVRRRLRFDLLRDGA